MSNLKRIDLYSNTLIISWERALYLLRPFIKHLLSNYHCSIDGVLISFNWLELLRVLFLKFISLFFHWSQFHMAPLKISTYLYYSDQPLYSYLFIPVSLLLFLRYSFPKSFFYYLFQLNCRSCREFYEMPLSWNSATVLIKVHGFFGELNEIVAA